MQHVSSLSQMSFFDCLDFMHVWKRGKRSHNEARCAHFNCDIYFSPDRPAFLPLTAKYISGGTDVMKSPAWSMGWPREEKQSVCREAWGEFTKACATLSASSDTLAFPADEPTEADSQRAFCAFQPPWNKADSLKCWSSRGPECSVILLSERKDCCCAAKLPGLFKNCFNPFRKVI